jgi:hypothetical protein
LNGQSCCVNIVLAPTSNDALINFSTGVFMKKSTLALSIAASLGGLGLAGNALAVTNVSGAAAGSAIVRNDNGIGHQLVFPYYTVQNGNATLLSITNTDTTNGKLVKVRFRGAANSDDVYDFQVAMSPGDIWTAAVTKDATTGSAKLATTDKSCTIPESIRLGTNPTFVLDRVDGASPAQTLEGYVEVINMADIPPLSATETAPVKATALFTAIKHASGVAPCTAAVLSEKLGTDGSVTDLTARGMAAPTTGLTGDWIVLNQNTTAAWSGAATALEVRASAGAGAATTGNLVFFPQILGAATSTGFTADPLITSGVLTAQFYDLPDMSTRYSAAATPADQADETTAQLAIKSLSNQFVTSDDIAAVTDIMFSQPMRRYSAVVNYKSSTVTDANGNTLQVPFAKNGTVARAIYRGASDSGLTPTTLNNVVYKTGTAGSALTAALGAGSKYYGPAANSEGTALSGSSTQAANLLFSTANPRILCLNSIAGPAANTIFDREETTPGSSTSGTALASFVISPNTAATTTATVVGVCGEAAVISINGTNKDGSFQESALSAVIARNDITSTDLTAYENGWIYLNTSSSKNSNGLPIIGQSFVRASNGTVNYGFSYSNKVTR